MRYSRTGIVAVLLAAEVFLGGAILWTLTGGRWAGSLQAAGSLHQVSEQGKTFAPIDAGSTPHVVIDDPDSRVVISSSTDGKVHVTDDTRTVGWVWGTSGPHATLSVAKTADGVSITRGDGQPQVAIIGFDYQHTDVEVPAGTFIDVRRCGARRYRVWPVRCAFIRSTAASAERACALRAGRSRRTTAGCGWRSMERT